MPPNIYLPPSELTSDFVISSLKSNKSPSEKQKVLEELFSLSAQQVKKMEKGYFLEDVVNGIVDLEDEQEAFGVLKQIFNAFPKQLYKQINSSEDPFLFTALERGHIEIFNFLIEKGADCFIKNADEENLLDIARRFYPSNRYPHITQEYIMDVACKACNTEDFRTKDMLDEALVQCVRNGSLEGIRSLLKNGAQVVAFDARGQSALSVACHYKEKLKPGALNIIKALLDVQGIESVFNIGWGGHASPPSPIHQAVVSGNLEIVKLLIERGAWIDPPSDKHHLQKTTTPLMLACLYAHKDIIELLLEKGADINFLDEYDQNALHCLADGGNGDPNVQETDNELACAKLLIDAGVLMDQRDINNYTPYERAQQNHRPLLAQYILSRLTKDTLVEETKETMARKIAQGKVKPSWKM